MTRRGISEQRVKGVRFFFDQNNNFEDLLLYDKNESLHSRQLRRKSNKFKRVKNIRKKFSQSYFFLTKKYYIVLIKCKITSILRTNIFFLVSTHICLFISKIKQRSKANVAQIFAVLEILFFRLDLIGF